MMSSALRHAHASDLRRVCALIERPARGDERVDGWAIQYRGAQTAALGFEIRIAHRSLAAAERMLDAALEHPAVGEPDPDDGRVLGQR
jgi:hypothetical protein